MRRIAALLLSCGVAGGLGAQAPSPGLALTIAPRVSREGSSDKDLRVASSLALSVDRDEAPSAFVGAGVFDATFEGEIELPARDDYVFSFYGTGSFTLQIDGETVLSGPGKGEKPVVGEAKRLRKGRRALLARYRTPLSGMAELRVAWEGNKLPPQWVPPTVLFHDPGTAGLADDTAGRAVRMSLATSRCTACHALPARSTTGMPELAMRGPSLRDAGARFEPAQLTQWILDPQRVRSAARMPRVLHGATAVQDAADIAAFLLTLGADQPVPSSHGDAKHGGVLWANLGCFTCHAIDAGDTEAWIDLTCAAALYRDGAIADFVAHPQAREPFIRMPDLKLSKGEADDLEAFLRSRTAAASPPQTAGDAGRGRTLFAARGCANCHDAGVPSSLAAADLATVLVAGAAKGCLASDDATRASAPDFGFDAASRDRLSRFGAGVLVSLDRDARVEFADRQLEERRCTACHQLGATGSLWTQREDRAASLLPPVEQVEGHVEVAQNRPPLTWVGEKLRIDWMEAFLSGREPTPRPWLHARMPRFGDELAHRLGIGLAARHGFRSDPEPPAIDRSLVAIGRDLSGSQGGFGCVTCHPVAGRAPAALFEVEGIDFARVASRLRPGYYASWMLDPTRYDPASKMPRFATEELRTALEPLGGDAKAQFGAIWQYLHGADELKEKR